jgi:hypothetical protein
MWIVGLTTYKCVMTGVVGIAFHFDLCQIILQQIDIFLHEFLKYWLLIKVGPGTVGNIYNVLHLFHLLLMYVPAATSNAKA